MQRQRQAAEQHEEQTHLNRKLQSELQAIQQQLNAEASKPKCPHCGGGVEIGYNVCKNCAREVIWVGKFVGLPGQEDQLDKLHKVFLAEEKRKRVKQREAENRRIEEQKRAAELKRQQEEKRQSETLATWIAALAFALWFFLFPIFLSGKGYSLMPNLWLWILGMVIVPTCVHFGMMKLLNAETR